MKKFIIYLISNIGIVIITFVTTSIIDLIVDKKIGSQFIYLLNYKFELWIYLVFLSIIALITIIYTNYLNNVQMNNKKFIIEKLSLLSDYFLLDRWTDFIDNAMRGFVAQEFIDNRKKVDSLLLTTIWPKKNKKTLLLIKNLIEKYDSFIDIYLQHAEPKNDIFYKEIKFYKSNGWNKNYKKDLENYKNWAETWYNRLNDFVYSLNQLIIHLSKKFDKNMLPKSLKKKYLLEDNLGVYNEMKPIIMLPNKKKGI